MLLHIVQPVLQASDSSSLFTVSQTEYVSHIKTKEHKVKKLFCRGPNTIESIK